MVTVPVWAKVANGAASAIAIKAKGMTFFIDSNRKTSQMTRFKNRVHCSPGCRKKNRRGFQILPKPRGGLDQLLYLTVYLTSRKNSLPPDLGTVTCHWLPTICAAGVEMIVQMP